MLLLLVKAGHFTRHNGKPVAAKQDSFQTGILFTNLKIHQN